MTDTGNVKPTETKEPSQAEKNEQSAVAALIDEYMLIHAVEREEQPKGLAELYLRIDRLGERKETKDEKILDISDPRAALCLSGGGIRSASFALGILQALAEKGILQNFHYLSTVSGGGYIGSWLTAWRHAVYTDASNVTLADKDKEAVVQTGLWHREPPYREPFELTGLRANSNYLTPKLGALSADTWALIALYLRNLMLNWLIFVPFFLALFLVPFGAEAVLKTTREWPENSKYLVAGAAALTAFWALVTSVRGRLGGAQRLRVTQGKYIRRELVPTYFVALLISLYIGMGSPSLLWMDTFDPSAGAPFGAVFYAAAWIVAYFFYGNRESLAPDGTPIPQTDRWQAFWAQEDYKLLAAWTFCGGIAGLLIGLGCSLATAACAAGHEKLLVIFGLGWLAVSLFIAQSVYLGLTSRSPRGDDEREWLARSSGWFLSFTIFWAGFAAIVLYALTIRIHVDGWFHQAFLSLFAVGSGVGAIAARIGASAKTLASSTTQKPAVSLPMTKVLALASVLFLITITVVMSSAILGLVQRLDASGLPYLITLLRWLIPSFVPGFGIAEDFYKLSPAFRHLVTTVILFAACAVGFGVFAFFVNVNRFSTHALYRNRLIRAFLGSARGQDGVDSPSRDPFTGFDTQDNLRFRDLTHPARMGESRPRLFHVVNMALNVVAGKNNAWQERKAESFAVTPRQSGNERVGMHPTETYASKNGGLTLGTAMAISGAAASPNQGYHSSPLVGLIMTLFNVRLGWWLGNPCKKAADQEGPHWGVFQIIEELFGLTQETSKFVYLSDGGHFENLGLYEMIRRRCRMIVVSDAGCDPDCTFEDLGNAVRKIWIDFGVRITFKKIEVGKRGAKPKPKLYYALGKITYPEAPKSEAYVLYIKPGFMNNGEEPADVAAYALANPSFPHQTTADQFFTKSQMESYRSLGNYTMKRILGNVGTFAGRVPMKALADYWANISKDQI